MSVMWVLVVVVVVVVMVVEVWMVVAAGGGCRIREASRCHCRSNACRGKRGAAVLLLLQQVWLHAAPTGVVLLPGAFRAAVLLQVRIGKLRPAVPAFLSQRHGGGRGRGVAAGAGGRALQHSGGGLSPRPGVTSTHAIAPAVFQHHGTGAGQHQLGHGVTSQLLPPPCQRVQQCQ